MNADPGRQDSDKSARRGVKAGGDDNKHNNSTGRPACLLTASSSNSSVVSSSSTSATEAKLRPAPSGRKPTCNGGGGQPRTKTLSTAAPTASVLPHSISTDRESASDKDSTLGRTSKQISVLPIDQKSAKIKQWVITRLTELEEQNKKLRVQNLRCSRQLQLLKLCAEKSADCRNTALLSHSVVGRLPVDEGKGGGGGAGGGDSSEDSGMGDYYGQLEWPTTYSQQQVATYQQIMCCSASGVLRTTVQQSTLRSTADHYSSPNTPRTPRKTGKAKANGEHRTHSLPRSSLHGHGKGARHMLTTMDETDLHSGGCAKPVPTPRRRAVDDCSAAARMGSAERSSRNPTACLLNDDLLQIERDSLDGGSGGRDSRHCEEAGGVMELTDSMCNLVVDRDSLAADCPDYVNIAELQLWQQKKRRQNAPPNGNAGEQPYCQRQNGNDGSRLPPPNRLPPIHKAIEPLEAKLHALAYQCLEMAQENSQLRNSIISGVSVTSPRNSHEQQSSASRTTSSDSYKIKKDSSYNGPLPVFTARHGKVSKSKHSNLSSGASSGGSSQNGNNKAKMCSDTTPTDLEECSPQPPWSSSGARSSNGSSQKRCTIPEGSILVENDHFGFTNCVREENEYNDDCSSSDGDYAVPPDAYDRLAPVSLIEGDDGIMQTSLVSSPSQVEKCGYLMSVSDGIIKSLKRRWCVLRNGEILLYKSQKDESKQDPALFRVTIDEVTSISKIAGKSGNTAGFQLLTHKSKHQLTAESSSVTDEWIKSLQLAMKGSTLVDLRQESPTRAAVRGWLTKVKYGHSKRYFATLQDGNVYFFKSAGVKVPSTQLQINGATVTEVTSADRGGSDQESSGADDGLNNNHLGVAPSSAVSPPSDHQYSLSVLVDGEDPVYLVFNDKEHKDRWLFHLKLAARDGHFIGSAFELCVQKLMEVDGNANSILWVDPLLQICDDAIKAPSTTMVNDGNSKDAVQLAKACFLFTSVPMQASAVAYHIDLAQNTLAQALKNQDLRGELYASLVRLSNGTMPYGIQAWKLLALVLSVCLPAQYQLVWLVRKHLQRWMCMGGEEANMAGYCRNAMERCLANGPRKEPPSKLETTSLLTRNPSAHLLPHSIPVCLPDGGYQVIEFDGSSTIGECCGAVCAKTKLRRPALSGFSLYADDPAGDITVSTALNPKAKICDVISKWEQNLKDCKSGRIPTGRVIKISLLQRYYWPHLSVGETEKERIFLAYQMADQLRQAKVPASPELAEELCALFVQMHFGDIGTVDDEKFEYILSRFYPARLLEVACKATLRSKLLEHWNDLKGSTKQDCSRVILGVLRRWRFFGAHLYAASMRWRNDERVALAVNDAGLHLLTVGSLEPIVSYAYSALVSFGGYHDDFMLTVSRTTTAADEPAKDRLTFSMPKAHVLTLTLHVADYIRLRRLVAPAAAHTPAQRRTPRKKSPHPTTPGGHAKKHT